MALEYYALLGLVPQRYPRDVIASRYFEQRQHLLGSLHDPGRYTESRQRLDELYLAYSVLSHPRLQDEYLRTGGYAGDAVGHLRAIIAGSLEDGLLRHSRRQAVLRAASRLGLSDFQAQLLMAQVQFDDEDDLVMPRVIRPHRPARPARPYSRAIGAGMLAAAIFLFLVRWLGA